MEGEALGLEYSGPIVGQALELEIAAMRNEESLQYMEKVVTMSVEEMNLENAFAEERARTREKKGADDVGAADKKKEAEDARGAHEKKEAEDAHAAHEKKAAEAKRPRPKPKWRGAVRRDDEDSLPQSRVLPSGKFMLSRFMPLEDWEDVVQMTGKNGMLLYVGALLWWGDAVAAQEDEGLVKEWQITVVDVASVLAVAGLRWDLRRCLTHLRADFGHSVAAANKTKTGMEGRAVLSSTRSKRQREEKGSGEDIHRNLGEFLAYMIIPVVSMIVIVVVLILFVFYFAVWDTNALALDLIWGKWWQRTEEEKPVGEQGKEPRLKAGDQQQIPANKSNNRDAECENPEEYTLFRGVLNCFRGANGPETGRKFEFCGCIPNGV
ncbi:hypothetical protein K438DRAFT_1747120 [Mycena galopus ATCC 62051]|nr:hypothetical protein K438DRAFT_1747120 [Mycena galopus ATCC 62051]